jgi:RNA polymerase sigma-70 factor, ECF subfamily
VNLSGAPDVLWLSSLLVVALLVSREQQAELFRRIATGDQRALRTVYELVSTRAMAIALRLLGDRSEAEDIVQDAFIEVWRRASQYQTARGSADAFVLTIVRSRAIDRLRARGTSNRVAAEARREPLPEPASPDPAGERVDRERVVAALASLPPEQKRVVELAYYEGLSQSEIAARTGEPLGTIKTRIRLAMAKLSDQLASAEDAA